MSMSDQVTPSIYHRIALGCAYGMTDVGQVRRNNEDNFLIDEATGLVAVADGMGGHDGGAIASRTVLEALREAVGQAMRGGSSGKRVAGPDDTQDPDATWRDQHMPGVLMLHSAVEYANHQVFEANVRNHNVEGGGMGTTLTGFWCQPGAPLITFHVGDTRLYRLRDGELTPLTRDQTLYQQALEEGLVDNLPPRNLLMQAIGPLDTVAPDVKVCDVQEGDLYMLCSDGLYGNVPHAALADALAQAGAQTLDLCCAQLIEMALAHGSRDNVTALLALCQR